MGFITSLRCDKPGGGPAAAHFLCLAKESKQRKATAESLPPLGVPEKVNAKVGSAETRLRLKHLHFFFHFGIHFFGSAKAELPVRGFASLALGSVIPA
jgi:hypothetical protein